MFRRPRHGFFALVFGASLPIIAVLLDAGAAPSPSLPSPPSKSKLGGEHGLECRAAKAAIDAELEQLRQSCDAAVAAFEACRAARPRWRDVELFSCGFDMSTSLTRGDVDSAASLEDCGNPSDLAARTPGQRHSTAHDSTAHDSTAAESRADCPVPACEADLEQLEAKAARRVC